MSPAPKTDEQKCELTPRERDVLLWVCEGKTHTDIATILGISRQGVRNHVVRIQHKLKVYSIAHLVRWAVREGLIQP
jgi:DNA-binding CsgD family transcriptional regulator